MVNFVTKKDGTKEPFDAEKIKAAVEAASTQAGLSDEDSAATAQKVLDLVFPSFGDRQEVASTEIKEKVLAELDTIAPDVSASWKKYDEAKGE